MKIIIFIVYVCVYYEGNWIVLYGICLFKIFLEI